MILTNLAGESLEFTCTPNNIHIVDSYKVQKDQMEEWLNRIDTYAFEQLGIVYERSIRSWIREWDAHNKLYKKNIQILRTKDVDLNEDEKYIKRIGYFFISLF